MSPTKSPPRLSSARSIHSPIESVLAFSIDCLRAVARDHHPGDERVEEAEADHRDRVARGTIFFGLRDSSP